MNFCLLLNFSNECTVLMLKKNCYNAERAPGFVAPSGEQELR